jgi:hypothetical protein
MAFTDAKWDGSASNYKDTDAYCEACLIDTNKPGDKKVQALCKLPVKTPDGDYNTNAMSAAAGALNGARNALTDVPPAEKAKAARKLKGLYDQAKMDVPPALKGMG